MVSSGDSETLGKPADGFLLLLSSSRCLSLFAALLAGFLIVGHLEVAPACSGRPISRPVDGRVSGGAKSSS